MRPADFGSFQMQAAGHKRAQEPAARTRIVGVRQQLKEQRRGDGQAGAAADGDGKAGALVAAQAYAALRPAMRRNIKVLLLAAGCCWQVRGWRPVQGEWLSLHHWTIGSAFLAAP